MTYHQFGSFLTSFSSQFWNSITFTVRFSLRFIGWIRDSNDNLFSQSICSSTTNLFRICFRGRENCCRDVQWQCFLSTGSAAHQNVVAVDFETRHQGWHPDVPHVVRIRRQKVWLMSVKDFGFRDMLTFKLFQPNAKRLSLFDMWMMYCKSAYCRENKLNASSVNIQQMRQHFGDILADTPSTKHICCCKLYVYKHVVKPFEAQKAQTDQVSQIS